MPDQTNKYSANEILRFLGVDDIATDTEVNAMRILPTTKTNQYSKTELEVLIPRIYQSRSPAKNVSPISKTPSAMFNYFRPIHNYIGEVIKDATRFKELGPEIKDAADITVSSILAPNDLQQAKPRLGFADDKSVFFSEDEMNNIIQFLENFYLNEFKLGKKLRDWINEALFVSGAKAVLVLPERVLNSLYNEGPSQGSEMMHNFNKTFINTKIPEKLDTKSLLDSTVISNQIFGGMEGYNKQLNKFIDEDLRIGAENLVPKVLSTLVENKVDLTKIKSEELSAGVEDAVINFATALKNGQGIHISENPEIIRVGRMSQDTAKRNLVNRYVDGVNTNQGSDTSKMFFVSLLDHMYGKDQKPSITHPLVMELPTEAVIPVCIPGSKEEHIGYFILIDEYGYPLESEKCLLCDSNCTNDGAARAYRTMFGAAADQTQMTNFSQTLVSSGMNGMRTFDPRKSALSSVFDFVLDSLLKNKLKNMGLGNVELGQFNAISACMLRRFFEKKETCLVFVPKDYMMYLAYDYRNDGTGNSILEGIKILLSIRATLLVAGMMSAANAAIPHKRIDVTFDENDTEWENTLQTVMEMAILKSNGGLYLAYADIMAAIADQHLTISPKNIHGIEGMNIERSETTNSSIRVDDSLLDTLTKMIIGALGVPPQALSQASGQEEFAISILTKNIFWANKISIQQDITEYHVSDFLRSHLKNDPILIKGLIEIFKGAKLQDIKDIQILTDESKKIADTTSGLAKAIETGTININEDDDQNILLKLKYVTDNLIMQLPTPTISADKAKYEEAKLVMDLFNSHVDQILNRDLIGKDSDIADMFGVFVAMFKSDAAKKIMEELGMDNIFNLPDMTDFAMNRAPEYRKFYQILRNSNAAFNQDKMISDREPSVPEDTSVEGETDVPSEAGSSSDEDVDMWN